MAILIVATVLSTLVLSLLLAQTDAVNGAPVQKLIDEACKNSASGGYKSCVAVLRQNPNISKATDAESLARIALGAVTEQSSNALALLALTIKSHPKAAKPLGECIDRFNDTKRELILYHEDLKERLASLRIHYAVDSVVTCQTVLSDAKVNIPGVGSMIFKWRTLYKPAYAAVLVAEG